MSFQRIVRGVWKSFRSMFVLLTVFASLGVSFAGAQDSLDRKVKSRISPVYPEIARKLNLSGVVKLEVVVTASGSVKETKVIGGNPILVNAAVDAVKKWKFEAGNEESTGVVEFKFDPSN